VAYTQSVTSNSNSSYTDWDYNYVYQDGVSFPSGRVNRDGANPVRLLTIGGGYSNLGSSYWSVYYGGLDINGAYTFSTSGGTMQVRQWNNDTARMYFGRNTGVAGTVYDNGDGSAFASGALAYTMTWMQVATAPASITATASGVSVTVTATASTDAGGGTISGYKVQYRSSANGSTGWSAWGSEQSLSSFSYTYSSLTPALYYQFRVYAVNEAGNSAATTSANVFVTAGGKRWTGSAWTPNTTAMRWSTAGTPQWIPLTIARRWSTAGTPGWVDLG